LTQTNFQESLQELAGNSGSPVWVVGEACAGLVEWQLQLIQHQEGVQVAQLRRANL
jgi:hypothetical protein